MWNICRSTDVHPQVIDYDLGVSHHLCFQLCSVSIAGIVIFVKFLSEITDHEMSVCFWMDLGRTQGDWRKLVTVISLYSLIGLRLELKVFLENIFTQMR